MPFDLGFNARATAIYVTDGAEGVPCLAENYPHTYTNGNGNSINAGWTPNWNASGYDRAATNDPRLAGINNIANGGAGTSTFVVDLSSGSAPGAGTYTVDLAMGDAVNDQRQDFLLKDGTTTKIDGTNGGAGINTTAGHFLDATVTDVAATTTWTGTPTSVTFAGTTVNLVVGPDSCGGNSQLAHFRLTLQAAGATAFPPRMLMLTGVGA